MRNIYIDLGAYNGDSVLSFMQWCNLIDKAPWEIYAFEPNPRMKETLEILAKERPNMSVWPHAAWTAMESIKMTIRPEDRPLGSTVMHNKIDWGQGVVTNVPAMDMAFWLVTHVEPGDQVIMKMDIEGAEFPVLDHLIKTGAINLITTLLIEWHDGKLKSMDGSTDYGVERKRIESEIIRAGVNLEYWT